MEITIKEMLLPEGEKGDKECEVALKNNNGSFFVYKTLYEIERTTFFEDYENQDEFKFRYGMKNDLKCDFTDLSRGFLHLDLNLDKIAY